MRTPYSPLAGNRAATFPSQLLGWDTDVVNEALEARDGLMPVPAGPGIGVTLNRDFVASRAELHEEWRA